LEILCAAGILRRHPGIEEVKEQVMPKKLMSTALAALLLLTPLGVKPVVASGKAEKQAKLAEKVKAGVLKLGVGKEARITVKLRDKTKLAGYVSEVREDSFVITDLNTGTATTVAYPEVAQVKGHHLSKGAKIAIIGLSVAVAVLAFFLWLENAD
jgi:hypothetical protein